MDLAKEPAEDVISGVSFLIKRGIADPDRLGILGHSHGAWLGPYVMAQMRVFRAASFAEGRANEISNYDLNPGWGALINEHYWGRESTPYENPQRWIDVSPAFHLRGLNTPTLLEYGEQGHISLLGVEFLHALWREGIPHEYVLYPKTGRNLVFPALQLESMNRNLDWFDYWILGRRDPAPNKQDQYARWERMTKEMEEMRTVNSNNRSRARAKGTAKRQR